MKDKELEQLVRDMGEAFEGRPYVIMVGEPGTTRVHFSTNACGQADENNTPMAQIFSKVFRRCFKSELEM